MALTDWPVFTISKDSICRDAKARLVEREGLAKDGLEAGGHLGFLRFMLDGESCLLVNMNEECETG